MGMGPGSFYPLFPYYTNEIEGIIMGVWAYAHNDYLQTLVEWGWLGTGFLAACIGGGYLVILREILYYRQHHSKRRFIYFRGYLLAMTTLLMHAVIEFPFQIESLAVVFSVMLGVAWAASELRGRDIRVRPKNYGPNSDQRKRDRHYRTRHRGDHLSRHH
jgi:O-antigen ligase